MTGTLYDPFDPAVLADPYPHYAALRRQSAVHDLPSLGMKVVCRHADAVSGYGGVPIVRVGDRSLVGRDRAACIALVLCAELLAGAAANAQTAFCLDLDTDGYFAGAACAVPPFDCTDQDAAVHPGAIETCNGWDDDCDGVSDPGCNTCPDFQKTRRVLINSDAASGRIAAADGGWAYIFNDGIEGFPLKATRLDFRGQGVSPQTVISGPTYIDSAPADPEVCWSGSEMSAGWYATNSHLGVHFRRLGPWGKPPAEITTISPFDGSDDGLLWNGYRYYVQGPAARSADRTTRQNDCHPAGSPWR